MADGDSKRELLAERSESLLLSLKQRFPNLSQTALDTTKIQCNKDVGKSILESYSRVLESLAFRIVARIDDLLHVDDLTKHSDKLALPASPVSKVKVPIPYSVSVLISPYKKTFSSPSFSPAHSAAALVSPVRRDRPSNKSSRHGFGVKRALTSYLGAE